MKQAFQLGRIRSATWGALAALWLLFPITAPAVDEDHRKLIQQFFELTCQKEQFKEGMIAGFDSQTGPEQFASLPEDQKQKALEGVKKVRKMMMGKVTWEDVEPKLIEAYAKVFTKEELEEILPLLDNPKMRAFFAKQVKVIAPALKASSELMAKLQPEIVRMMEEAMQP